MDISILIEGKQVDPIPPIVAATPDPVAFPRNPGPRRGCNVPPTRAKDILESVSAFCAFPTKAL